MSKQNIETLFNQTNELLTQLAVVSNEKGMHLDNDLESGLFELLLDDNYNEIYLLKNRVESAIQKIKDGTFKVYDTDKKFDMNKHVA